MFGLQAHDKSVVEEPCSSGWCLKVNSIRINTIIIIIRIRTSIIVIIVIIVIARAFSARFYKD